MKIVTPITSRLPAISIKHLGFCFFLKSTMFWVTHIDFKV